MMRTKVKTLLLFMLAGSAASAADLKTQIEEVVVYPAGATITRVAGTNLNQGANDIRLVGLVGSLDADRIQIEVLGSDVQIGQIRLSTEQQREAYDEEVARVAAEIEAMNGRIRAVDDSSAAARLRLKFLDNIAVGYGKDAAVEAGQGTADVQSWRAALEVLQTGSEDASRLIRENEVEKAALNKEMSVLQRTFADLRGGSLQSVAVEVTLNSARAQNTDIRLRYYQEDAYWSPLYESRLDSNSGTLKLMQQAAVSQQTDEDWNNVRLILSTSQPEGDLSAPEIDSEFLDLMDPAVRSNRNRGANLDVGSQAMSGLMLEEVVVTGAKRNPVVGNFAVSYPVPGLVNIANDSDEDANFDLAEYEFSTELVTAVVPRQSPSAYLTARFVYDQAAPLYGSDMAVYVDGVFAGYSEMPTALPQAEVSLPMGQDRRIDVKVESQGGAGGTGGIINKRQTEVTDYLFEIVNRRDKASYVEVLDRVPVPRNRSIDVDVPRSATQPDEEDVDDQPGLVLWKKNLTPGETWRIRHQYSVSYPEDRLLIQQ